MSMVLFQRSLWRIIYGHFTYEKTNFQLVVDEHPPLFEVKSIEGFHEEFMTTNVQFESYLVAILPPNPQLIFCIYMDYLETMYGPSISVKIYLDPYYCSEHLQ